MMNLLEYINNNQTLKQLFKYLEFGLNTEELRCLLPHLNAFNLGGGVMNNEDVDYFRQIICNEMTSRNYSSRDVMEMDNILAVFGKAALTVQLEVVPDNEVDLSKSARVIDCIKNINDQDLQLLWGKILVQLLKQPNTIFKRTLDVFYKADKFEIDWFFEITKFVFDKSCIPEFVITNNKFYPFNRFQTLIDAGFVNASQGRLSYSETQTIRLTSADIKIEITNPPFGIGVYTLTDAGSQIFDLKPEATPDEFINKLKEVLEQGNVVKVVSIEKR